MLSGFFTLSHLKVTTAQTAVPLLLPFLQRRKPSLIHVCWSPKAEPSFNDILFHWPLEVAFKGHLVLSSYFLGQEAEAQGVYTHISSCSS